MHATDFQNSYMTWSIPHNPADTRKPGHKPWGNSARILLEARCVLTDGLEGSSEEFFLIAGCRTEWMYQEADLFQIPGGEYRAVWSRERFMGTGSQLTATDDPRSSTLVRDVFTSLSFTVRTCPAVTILDTDEAVVKATRRELPIVAQTEIWSEDGSTRAMIEYPVKTMNFHPERIRFQVDTGPLLLPDFTHESEHRVECFDMAHVVYNTFDRAEFIVQRATPVIVDGREVCKVDHYSQIRVHEAKHTLLCAGEL